MARFTGHQVRQFTIEEMLAFLINRRARWGVHINYPDLSEFGCHSASRRTYNDILWINSTPRYDGGTPSIGADVILCGVSLEVIEDVVGDLLY
jgi:hypothetical protein